MARGAAKGTRRGPPGGPRRPRGCGAGSSAGTGSAAGWRPPSPWVRSCRCLFLVPVFFLGYTASQLTGLAPPVVGPGGRAGRASGCPKFARRCRYAGCQEIAKVAQSERRLTPTSVVASLHYRKSLKPSANHRSRAGKERSGRPGRNCGASQTAARDDEQRVMS